jgi:glycosyltransferase involved in cell wall biosynthesis
MARQSSGVIVTNIADEQELHEAGNMPPVKRIPIGSNIAARPPENYDRDDWRVDIGIPSHVFLVGYFGFINATKGVDTLAHAIRLMIERGFDAELLIIGGQTGDSDKTNIQQADAAERLIGGLGIGRRVHWTGFLESEQVSAYLLGCDVIALPFKDGVSFRRGTLMASLAHGCPIVTTLPDVAIPELKDGDAVRMVPPNSPNRLAEVLLELAKDESQRELLGQAAAELAKQFQWDTIAAATIHFMGQVNQREIIDQ